MDSGEVSEKQQPCLLHCTAHNRVEMSGLFLPTKINELLLLHIMQRQERERLQEGEAKLTLLKIVLTIPTVWYLILKKKTLTKEKDVNLTSRVLFFIFKVTPCPLRAAGICFF